MNNDMKTKLLALSEPMPYQWKVNTFVKDWNTGKVKGGWCVAYIDVRSLYDRMNSVFGLHWSSEPIEVNGQTYCKISVYDIDQKIWVHRCNLGVESFSEKEKGKWSDSEKRTGVEFGVGAFLYRKEMKYIECSPSGEKSGYPIDKSGKRIYNLTQYFIDHKIDDCGREFEGLIFEPTEEEKQQDQNGTSEEEMNIICNGYDNCKTIDEINAFTQTSKDLVEVNGENYFNEFQKIQLRDAYERSHARIK